MPRYYVHMLDGEEPIPHFDQDDIAAACDAIEEVNPAIGFIGSEDVVRAVLAAAFPGANFPDDPDEDDDEPGE